MKLQTSPRLSRSRERLEGSQVDIADGTRVMPDELCLMMQVVGDGEPRVVVAVTARENDYAYFHSAIRS